MKTKATSAQTIRANKHAASKAWEALSSKQRSGVVGLTYFSILQLLDESGTAPLSQVLHSLFDDVVQHSGGLRAAHTMLGTQFVNRPPLDDQGQPLLKLCVDRIARQKAGTKPLDEATLYAQASVWFEVPNVSAALERLETVPNKDIAQRFTDAPALRLMGAQTGPHAKAAAQTAAFRQAHLEQCMAVGTKQRLNYGHQSSRHGFLDDPLDENDSIRSDAGSKNFTPTKAKKRNHLSSGYGPAQGSRLRHGNGGESIREDDFGRGIESDRGGDFATGQVDDVVMALEEMLRWARDGRADSPALCVLLGESGTGKTSHGQVFTRVLNGMVSHPDWEVGTGPAAPVTGTLPKALFIDLAELTVISELAALSLEEMLLAVLKKRDGISIQNVSDVAPFLEQARAGQLILVFDGLDELIFKNSASDLLRVFTQFLRVVEQGSSGVAAGAKAPRQPKIVVSCRSHYFRDVEQQHAFFTARKRASVDEKDYLCLTLLPWDKAQILAYLTKRVGEPQAHRLLGLIDTTYNLAELASRPVLLSMMVENLEALLEGHAAGATILASTLYNQTVAGWIERDYDKHRLTAAHKPLLMGALATAMWNDASEQWSCDRLDNWLATTMKDLFSDHYDLRDLPGLQEDLRTATFIVRPHERDFNFAHRSYSEYFLARFLVDALTRVSEQEWTLAQLRRHLPSRPLNKETLEFLTELWEFRRQRSRTDELTRMTGVLCQLLQDAPDAPDAPNAPLPAPPINAVLWQLVCTIKDIGFLSDLSLHHSTTNGTVESAHTSGGALNLRGLSLTEQLWQGLRLQNAPALDLRGTDLRGTHFRHCNFGRVLCDANTNLSQTVWRECDTSQVDWQNARRGGMVLRSAEPALQHGALTGPWALPVSLGGVPCMAFSPGGTVLATGSVDKTARLWDATTGRCLHTLQGHTDSVGSVAFSPSGTVLATGSDDKTARLWDATTGRCLHILQGHTDSVVSVAFSPDGTVLATGSRDRSTRLWDATTARCLHILLGHTDSVVSVAFSPDGTVLATGSNDDTARLWDATTGRCLHTLQGHTVSVRSVAFSPDGTLLATGSGDNTACLWDATTGRCLHTLQGHTHSIGSVAFSPNGTLLATGSGDNTACLWDAITGRCQHTLQGHTNSVGSVAFSPDGILLATGSYDNTAGLWDATTGRCLHTLHGRANSVRSVAFSPGGTLLATGSYDRTARLWDATTGRCLYTLQGHTDRVRSVAFSPSGTLLATGSDDDTARLWDATTGRCLHTLQGHTDRVWSVAFSSDGTVLATGSGDKTARLWDATTGRCLHTLQGHTNSIGSVAFSSNGTLLATGSGDNTACLWDAITGRCLHTLQGHTNSVGSVAFSPDGKVLAAGSYDNTAGLWDATTGRCLHTLQGHTDWVLSVAFSPDGTVLATGSDDHTTRLWDVQTGRELRCLQGHGGRVASVTFSPDCKQLVTASTDGTVRLWDLGPDQGPGKRAYRVMVPHPKFPFEPSWADFDANDNLLAWSEAAPEHWLFLLRNGRSDPIEAAM